LTAQVLTIAGANASGFAGVNGGTANAAGLSLTGANFGVAVATDKLDPARRWITTQATVSSVAVLGIPDVTISGSNLAVRVNRSDLDGIVANYSVTPLNIPLSGGSSYTINIDGSKGALLEASGTLTVSVSDFFNVTGSFALRRSAANITLADGTTKDVSLLTLGVDGASAFVGLNAGTDNAAGLSITNADAAIAIASDLTDPTKRWTAIEASLDGISVTGLSDVTIAANSLNVEINRASGTQAVVDWAATPLVVTTGPASSITLNMAGADGTLLRASGNLTIKAGGFFSVTGALAIEKKTDTVKLHGSSTDVPVDLLTIGGSQPVGICWREWRHSQCQRPRTDRRRIWTRHRLETQRSLETLHGLEGFGHRSQRLGSARADLVVLQPVGRDQPRGLCRRRYGP
jgi:redox-sensitive bicupin YhaK (pirin superfamily)